MTCPACHGKTAKLPPKAMPSGFIDTVVYCTRCNWETVESQWPDEDDPLAGLPPFEQVAK